MRDKITYFFSNCSIFGPCFCNNPNSFNISLIKFLKSKKEFSNGALLLSNRLLLLSNR